MAKKADSGDISSAGGGPGPQLAADADIVGDIQISPAEPAVAESKSETYMIPQSVIGTPTRVETSTFVTRSDLDFLANQLAAQTNEQLSNMMFRIQETMAAMGTPRGSGTPSDVPLAGDNFKPSADGSSADGPVYGSSADGLDADYKSAEAKQNESEYYYNEDVPMARTSMGDTPRKARRESMYHEDVEKVAAGNRSVLVDNPVPITRLEQDIPAMLMNDNITLRSFRKAKYNRDIWAHGKRFWTYLIADFFKPSVLRSLVHTQQIIEAPGWENLNEFNIRRSPDTSFKKYFADGIRVTLKGRKDLFIFMFTESVNGLRPTHNSSWDPSYIIGWEEEIFTPISLLLKEIQENYDLLYYGLSAGEAAELAPPAGWGDNDEQGLLYFCMNMLDNDRPRGHDGRGVYFKIFFNRIGKPALRLMKTVKQWAAAIMAENQKLAQESQRLRKEQATLVGPPTIARVNERMEKKKTSGQQLNRGYHSAGGHSADDSSADKRLSTEKRGWQTARGRNPFNKTRTSYLKSLMGGEEHDETDETDLKTSGLSQQEIADAESAERERDQSADQSSNQYWALDAESADEGLSEEEHFKAACDTYDAANIYNVAENDQQEAESFQDDDRFQHHLAALMGNQNSSGRPSRPPFEKQGYGQQRHGAPGRGNQRQDVRQHGGGRSMGQQGRGPVRKSAGPDRYLKRNCSADELLRFSQMPCFDYYEHKCTRGSDCALNHSPAMMQKIHDEFVRKIQAHTRVRSSADQSSADRPRQMFGESQQHVRIMQRPTTGISRYSPDYDEPDENLDHTDNRVFLLSNSDHSGEEMTRKATR